MPTYEFRCPQGHEFEKFYRSISGAEARAACPQCGQDAERIMSAAGFAFKGSGFYLTDYGKNAHRGTDPASAAPAGDSAAGESKSDTKSDTKSDAKSDTKGDAKADSRGETKARSDTGSGGASTGSGSSSPAAGGDARPAAPKPAESKPAKPPKKSSGE
jgi:putative FmdB family regulatory protein